MTREASKGRATLVLLSKSWERTGWPSPPVIKVRPSGEITTNSIGRSEISTVELSRVSVFQILTCPSSIPIAKVRWSALIATGAMLPGLINIKGEVGRKVSFR
jgi:hypothetical protein